MAKRKKPALKIPRGLVLVHDNRGGHMWARLVTQAEADNPPESKATEPLPKKGP